MAQTKVSHLRRSGGRTIDPQRPSDWVPYRKGMCEGCSAGCCTLPVEASAFDLIRLEVMTEDEAAAGLKKAARRLIKEGMIRSYHPSRGLFVLEQKNGTDCIFLDSNRLCTVYEKRPEVCRTFPKIGPRPGFCPASYPEKSKAMKGRS